MNDDKKYLLAIDNGTQSVRALVFDLDGQLVAKSKIEIEAYFSEQPGWAEQHTKVAPQIVRRHQVSVES